MAWFHSLKLLPLVQAVAVGYTAPIFISLLAMLVLGERPGRWIWAALALGVLGCAVGLWPELSAQTGAGSAARVEGQLAALVSAVCYAGVVVLARHQAQRDALWTILLVQNLCWPATRRSATRCGPSCWCRTCCRWPCWPGRWR